MNNYITSQGNVTLVADENEIHIRTLHSSPIIYKNAKKFVDDIPVLFKNAKGILLDVFIHSPIGFKTNIDFCEAIRKKFDVLHIRYSFLSPKSSTTSYIIFFANVKLEFGETVFVVVVSGAELWISEYEFTLNGYKVLSDKRIDINVKEEDSKLIRDKILGESNPKKIILVCAEGSNAKFFRTVLKSKKLVAFDRMPEVTENAVDEIAKWLFDESVVKHHIIPMCERNYFFITVIGEKTFPITFLEPSERLPVNKTFTVSECNEKIVVSSFLL
uniref:Uncharacterized protein n=1 Tax=Panagrolaimus davidi TaxID=227884 RepID=A0A914R251_9BILA